MGLTICKDCGGPVSTAATVCPKCGRAKPKRTSLMTWIVGGVFAVWVFSCTLAVNSGKVIGGTPAEPAVEAREKAEKAHKDREINMVLHGAIYVKSTMKKPETFALTRAFMIDGKTICYEYTARNSWNDQAKGVYVITDTVSTSRPAEWNMLCAGKSGDDYTSVRAVMP